MMVWSTDWRGLCSVKMNVCAHVFACVCVCVRERERERWGWEMERERDERCVSVDLEKPPRALTKWSTVIL